jgi:3-hydroxyisobutyrate dehydrogenase-like beta-hydroxyacid dehydrogenase
MHKDLTLAMETAYAQNTPMPTASTVKEVYGSAKAQGKGDLDYAAVITFLEELAGVKVRVGDATA